MSGRPTVDIIAELRTLQYPTIRRRVILEAADRLAELDRISELLAAALLIRGVEAKDCDALDQWLRP